ncbi:MAG: ComGF family competence protein [Erysipelotrichaceae bacterium]|nr:ComGF family competence protein [Erysipelotrichaceae bacterium]
MKFMKQEQGFTMIEALLSLLCAALFCIVLSQTALIIVKSTRVNHEAEDILAIKQLQLILAQSKSLRIVQNELHFIYHQEDFYLTRYKNALVKRKGFEVILQDIDSVRFTRSGSCYHLSYERNHQKKGAVLGCEK